MTFYLGTHMPDWLGKLDVPLFVSRRRLAGLKALPRARGRWALDSGGFTELQMYGGWRHPPELYAAEVRRYRDEVGNLDWAPIQDWMCEQIVIAGGRAGPNVFVGTKKSVAEHQRLTIESWLRLTDLAPDLPWVAVVQGDAPDDYLRHIDQYLAAGVDIRTHDRVGVGSVCRRQSGAEGLNIVGALHAAGIKSHGFGIKVTGFDRGMAGLLTSADSMAWSFRGRRGGRMAGCTHVFTRGPKKGTPSACGNCVRFALAWRDKVLAKIEAAKPPGRLFW